MDPEQLVAHLAELRTQNQQFHPGVAADATAASSTARPRPSLDRLATIPSGDSGRGSGTVTNPARGNPTLVDTKGLGKPPPLKNTDSEFVSQARRTETFVVSVHPGARDVLTWAVERESATVRTQRL